MKEIPKSEDPIFVSTLPVQADEGMRGLKWNSRTYASAVLRSFAWEGGASVIGQAISWLSTIIVIRLLAPEDYGLMAMAALGIGFLVLVSDLGIGAAAIQARSLDTQHLRELFGFVVLLNLLAGMISFLSAPLVAAFFGEPRVIPLVKVLSFCFVFLGLYVLPQALTARELRFDQKAKVDVVAGTISALATLSFAVAGFGVWSLVGGMLANHVIKAVAFQVVRPCLFIPAFSIKRAKNSIGFGGLVTLDRMLWYFYGSMDVAIAGRVLGKSLVGVYAVALSLASIPLDKIMPVITKVSFAALSLIQDDRERVRRNVLRAIQGVGLVTFPLFIGMTSVAPEFVALLLGSKWLEIVVPFQILCIVLPLKALGSLFAPALFAIGRPQVNIVNNAITLGVMSVAFLMGVQHGVIGLCVAWLVGYPVAFSISSYRAMSALGIRFGEAVSVVRVSVVGTLVMAAAVGASRAALSMVLPLPALLVSLILVGAGVYVLMVLTFSRDSLHTLQSVIRIDR